MDSVGQRIIAAHQAGVAVRRERERREQDAEDRKLKIEEKRNELKTLQLEHKRAEVLQNRALNPFPVAPTIPTATPEMTTAPIQTSLPEFHDVRMPNGTVIQGVPLPSQMSMPQSAPRADLAATQATPLPLPPTLLPGAFGPDTLLPNMSAQQAKIQEDEGNRQTILDKLRTQVHPGSEYGLYSGTGEMVAPPAAKPPKPPEFKSNALNGGLESITDPNTGAIYHAGNIASAPQAFQQMWGAIQQQQAAELKRKEAAEAAKQAAADDRQTRQITASSDRIAQAFALNNPIADEAKAKYIADQVRDNPLNWNLTAGNKSLQEQVRTELSKGEDVNRLTASTRQLGETADVVVPKIDALIKKLDDPKLVASLGPVMGRWYERSRSRGDPGADWLDANRRHAGARRGAWGLGHAGEV